MMDLLSKIVDTPIDTMEALDFVRDPRCGAVVTFEGAIRSDNKGQKVISLFYEVYDALFHKINNDFVNEINTRWELHRLAVIQRRGHLDVGEVGIVIAASSEHRRDALEALDYVIEQFKKRSPVWKQEVTEVGTEWINWPLKHQSAK